MSISVSPAVECPLCGKTVGQDRIDTHIDSCLKTSEDTSRSEVDRQLAELREQRRKAIAEINSAFNELERKQTADYQTKLAAITPSPTPTGVAHWLHQHPLTLSTLTTPWDCDGCGWPYTGAVRRRCTQGCDYDLCASCWLIPAGSPLPPKPVHPLPTPTPITGPRPRAPGPNSLDCNVCWSAYGHDTGTPSVGVCDGCNTATGCASAHYCAACSYRLNRCQTCRANVQPVLTSPTPTPIIRPFRPEVAR